MPLNGHSQLGGGDLVFVGHLLQRAHTYLHGKNDEKGYQNLIKTAPEKWYQFEGV